MGDASARRYPETPERRIEMKMRSIFIYASLALGALIFAWPFLWMAATSAKLDREMFGGTALLPERPLPRTQSPYVDDRLFARVTGPRLDEALPIIEERIAALA